MADPNWVLLSSQVVSTAGMLALAAWLLWLNFASRVHRSFALVLFLRALITILTQGSGLVRDGDWASGQTMVAVRDYVVIALPFVLAYFLVVYIAPKRRRLHRHALLGLLAGGALIEGAFLLDHCLVACRTTSGSLAFGPLGVLFSGLSFWFAAAGLAVAFYAASRPPGAAEATPALLLSAGLGGVGLMEAGIPLGLLAAIGWDASLASFEPNAWAAAGYLAFGGGLLPGLLLPYAWWRAAQRDPTRRPMAVRLVMLAAASFLLGIMVGLTPAFGLSGDPALFLVGLGRLVLPGLAVYALVRHNLFNADARIRFGLRHSTVAAIYVSVFFVTSETTAAYFATQTQSSYLGIAAAAVLLLALHPLQGLGKRLAGKAMPTVRPIDKLDDQGRRVLYREQLTLAWRDGMMSHRERILLDRMRQRLAIPADVAAHIESEVLAEHRDGGSAPTQASAHGRQSLL